MKTIIIIAILSIIALACQKEDMPVEQIQYTLEQLENDTNWVEIIDIDTLKQPVCIEKDRYNHSIVIETAEEFNNLYKNSEDWRKENSIYFTQECSDEINVDFKKRTLILVASSNGGFPVFKRKIFINYTEKKIIYYLENKSTSTTEDLKVFHENITIPKFNNSFDILFQIDVRGLE